MNEAFFHRTLLAWFACNRRDFPWRNDPIEPFVSLVTELLLQRTKADSIAGTFPLILDVYRTPEQVITRGQARIVDDLTPLGLQQRRAASLVDIATDILEHHGGKVPATEEDLLQLQGVGKYIANAVLCFGFGQPAPIVDGNVTRLFCRFFNLENRGDNRRNVHIWEKAGEIIDIEPETAKQLNWAILDFAALVCTPRNPRCIECALNEHCNYYSSIIH
jgi:A/G-specific adenine glycosylase